MEIGSKLKNVRTDSGLTQEQVAERIGVSRQTVSNWENNKSYPDIISVINLSELYSISLDELLKGDRKMINHLEESTNTVKAKQKHTRIIEIISYLVIWAVSILAFWCGIDPEGTVYAIFVIWVILPVTTLVISACIGKDENWGKSKWLMPIFFALMSMLAPFLTFDALNMLHFGNFNTIDITSAIPGLVCSILGIGIGLIIKAVKERKNRI